MRARDSLTVTRRWWLTVAVLTASCSLNPIGEDPAAQEANSGSPFGGPAATSSAGVPSPASPDGAGAAPTSVASPGVAPGGDGDVVIDDEDVASAETDSLDDSPLESDAGAGAESSDGGVGASPQPSGDSGVAGGMTDDAATEMSP